MRQTAVIVKELIQLKRDPRSLVMIAMMPLIVMLLFGVGYGGGMGKIGIAVVNLDKGSLSWTKDGRNLSETSTINVVIEEPPKVDLWWIVGGLAVLAVLLTIFRKKVEPIGRQILWRLKAH